MNTAQTTQTHNTNNAEETATQMTTRAFFGSIHNNNNTTTGTHPMINANEIKFGVEFETHINEAHYSETTVGGYHRGEKVDYLPAVSHTGRPTHWKAETDSSICEPYDREGVEFVSPILKGSEGIENVASTLAILRAKGARVNQSCGMHVTVEWSGDAAALARLISLVANHETGIYASTGTHSRENGNWARKIKHYGNDTYAKERMDYGRYHLLNITHVAAGDGRVEFRAFAGTLNTTKAIAAIQMAIGFVQLALADGRKSRWSHPTKPASHANMTDGQYEVARIYYRLGWTKGLRKADHPLRDVKLGAIENRAASIAACKKMTNKMAKKYDGATCSC